jgi:hypothetical protein
MHNTVIGRIFGAITARCISTPSLRKAYMTSEVAYFPEALASPSEATYHRAFNRGRHLKTRHIRSHAEVLPDPQRFFIELCVNPHPRTHNILVNTVDNQRQMADLSDYNVAHNNQNNPEFCRKPSVLSPGLGSYEIHTSRRR